MTLQTKDHNFSIKLPKTININQNLTKVAIYSENNGTMLSGEILNITERLTGPAHNSSALYRKLHWATSRK